MLLTEHEAEEQPVTELSTVSAVRCSHGAEPMPLFEPLTPAFSPGVRGHLVSFNGHCMDFVPELTKGRPSASTSS